MASTNCSAFVTPFISIPIALPLYGPSVESKNCIVCPLILIPASTRAFISSNVAATLEKSIVVEAPLAGISCFPIVAPSPTTFPVLASLTVKPFFEEAIPVIFISPFETVPLLSKASIII